MRWFVYKLAPIDFGWWALKTLKQTLHDLVDCREHLSDEGCEASDVASFLARWEQAKAAARDDGWEGDFRHEPSVFWVPVDEGFLSGFVFKQDNNGTTFVVSPVLMPWLEA